jgi:endonuclease/exonuclease/phosphatase family metal-dependent hydrolase
MRKIRYFFVPFCTLILVACAPSQTTLPVPKTLQVATETLRPINTSMPVATATASKVNYYEFFEKPADNSFRVLSYNINWDSIFPVGDPDSHELRSYTKSSAFVRVIQAIQPDIVCLQEINPSRDPQQVSDILDAALPGEEGQSWTSTITRDSLIATRFDLLVEGYEMSINSVIPNLPQAAALIDLPDDIYGPLDIYAFCAHFKSSGSVADILMRSRQADVIMSHLRDATSAGESLDLPEGTPVLILGDFNVYDTDPAEHLTQMLTGDIRNEDRFGADFGPDWDGTELTDALPSQNGLGLDFNTWRDDQSVFEVNVLDHIF